VVGAGRKLPLREGSALPCSPGNPHSRAILNFGYLREFVGRYLFLQRRLCKRMKVSLTETLPCMSWIVLREAVGYEHCIKLVVRADRLRMNHGVREDELVSALIEEDLLDKSRFWKWLVQATGILRRMEADYSAGDVDFWYSLIESAEGNDDADL